MNIHLLTDCFSVGGGIEHIYQIVSHIKNIKFDIFAAPGPAIKKFEPFNHVTTHAHHYAYKDFRKKSPDLIHVHHLKPLANLFKNPFKKKNVSRYLYSSRSSFAQI